MKKTLIFFAAVMTILSVNAQTNNNHLMLDGAYLYQRGLEGTIAYEHGTNYHNAWEFFASYYIKYDIDPIAGHITSKSFWDNYRTWHLGIAYKPCVARGRNSHGNFRIGATGGSDMDHFVGGIHVGYEQTYTLYSNWEFFMQVKADCIISGEDLFRTGVAIGVKFPLN